MVAADAEGHYNYSENGAEVFACSAGEEVAAVEAVEAVEAVPERSWVLQGSEEVDNDTAT